MTADRERPLFLDTDHASVSIPVVGSGAGLHILLVVGDLDTAENLSVLLRRDGHRLRIALDGPNAVRHAQAHPPDVVLFETGLPRIDASEMVKALNQVEQPGGKRPFFIAVTGHEYEADYQRPGEPEIDIRLEKPVDPCFLRSLLQRFQRIILPSEGLPEGSPNSARNES